MSDQSQGSDGLAADRLAGPRPARDSRGRFAAPHPTAGSMAITNELDRLLRGSARARLERAMAEPTSLLSGFVETEQDRVARERMEAFDQEQARIAARSDAQAEARERQRVRERERQAQREAREVEAERLRVAQHRENLTARERELLESQRRLDRQRAAEAAELAMSMGPASGLGNVQQNIRPRTQTQRPHITGLTNSSSRVTSGLESSELIARDVVAYNRGYERAIQDVMDFLASHANSNEPMVVREVATSGRQGLLADDDHRRGGRLDSPGRRVVWTRVASPARGVYSWADDGGRVFQTTTNQPPDVNIQRQQAWQGQSLDWGYFSEDGPRPVPESVPPSLRTADGLPPWDVLIEYDMQMGAYHVLRGGARVGTVTIEMLRTVLPAGAPARQIHEQVVQIWWSRHGGDGFSPFAPRETDPGGLNGALAPAAPRRRRVLDMSGALVSEDLDGDAARDPEHADPVGDPVE